MPGYVDGFVIPVPKDKVDAYMDMAREGASSGASTARSSSASASPTTWR
jgi:uncharacterized protein YbaA (DUF1428 family)